MLRELGPEIQWVHSYVTDDKIYCIYRAPSEDLIREHAQRGGFPANAIAQVRATIDPTTARLGSCTRIAVAASFATGARRENKRATREATMKTDGAIDYVELPGGNLAEIKRFYAAAFGWRFIDYGPTYVAVEGAGLDARLQAPPTRRPTKPLVILYAEDLEAMLDEVEAAGGEHPEADLQLPRRPALPLRATRPATSSPSGGRTRRAA